MQPWAMEEATLSRRTLSSASGLYAGRQCPGGAAVGCRGLSLCTGPTWRKPCPRNKASNKRFRMRFVGTYIFLWQPAGL